MIGRAATLAAIAAVALPGAAPAHSGHATTAAELPAAWTEWEQPFAAAADSAALALDIARAIARDPDQVTGASWTNLPTSGTPNGVSTTAAGSFPVHGGSYGVLTTGNVGDAYKPQAAFAGTRLMFTQVPGRGDTAWDVSVLKVDLAVPDDANCLWVRFAYHTEEYPSFIGKRFNDAIVAELDATTWTTSGSTISAPGNFAFDTTGSVVSVNSTGHTSMSAANAAGTVYGGGTVLLAAAVPVTPGAHSAYFSIFDQGDAIYDSAVFLDDLVLDTVPAGACTTGARLEPPAQALTAAKTADAETVSPGGAGGYEITLSNPGADAVTVESITDTLPSGFAYAGPTTGITTSDPAVDGGKLTWSGPFTVPGDGGTVSLHFGVTAATTPGEYFNTAGAVDAAGATVASTGPTARIVVEGNRPPVAEDQEATTLVDMPVPIRLGATDPDGNELAFTVLTQPDPAHGTLSGTGRDLTFTPKPGFVGDASFTFQAHDGTDPSNVATVTIHVIDSCAPTSAQPGGIFISGHDAEAHAAAGTPNKEGAVHIVQRAVGWTSRDKANPRVLLVTTTSNPARPDADARVGLQEAGFSSFDVAHAAAAEPGALDLRTVDFGDYDAVVVASDPAGWLTQAESDALAARSSELLRFVNAGGGLVVFSQAVVTRPFGFLPFVASAVPSHFSESGVTLEQLGIDMGLTAADVNGNVSHNVFRSTSGLGVVDRDDGGRILSLGVRGERLDVDGPCASRRIRNGHFERPVIAEGIGYVERQGAELDHWTVEGAGVDHIPEALWVAAEGRQSVDLNASGPGSVWQDVATEPGAHYTLRFSMAANPQCGDAVRELSVWWDGAELSRQQFDGTGRTQEDPGWEDRAVMVRASGATTRLGFKSETDGACGPALDFVRLEPAEAPRPTLRVERIGNGSGTVESVGDSTIVCGTTCQATYDPGTPVKLRAVPEPGSRFIGWRGGGCGGTGDCDVTIEDDTTVEAIFVKGGPLTWSLARDYRVSFDGPAVNPLPDERGIPDVWRLGTTAATGDLDAVRSPSAYTWLDQRVSDPVLAWRSEGVDGFAMGDTPESSPYPHTVALASSADRLLVARWRSPISGRVQVTGGVTDIAGGAGNGVRWFVDRDGASLASGTISDGGCETGSFGPALHDVAVAAGDELYFVVDPRGPDGGADAAGDVTTLDVTITEVEPGAPAPPSERWELARDMRRAPILQNANMDAYGHACAWTFEQGDGVAHDAPSTKLPTAVAAFGGNDAVHSWGGSFAGAFGQLYPFVLLSTADAQFDDVTLQAGRTYVHPAPGATAIVRWRSPFSGHVRVTGSLGHADSSGGDGVTWAVDRNGTTLAEGVVLRERSLFPASLSAVPVDKGDTIAFIAGPGGAYEDDTVELDAVIERIEAPDQELTVIRAGEGDGSVRSRSHPGTIECAPDCSHGYPHGTEVTLVAKPAPRSRFTGWSGACSGLGRCRVTMDQAREVTATFAPSGPWTWSLARDLRRSFDADPAPNPAPDDFGNEDVWSLGYSDAAADLDVVRDPSHYHVAGASMREPFMQWSDPGMPDVRIPDALSGDMATARWYTHAAAVHPNSDRLAVVGWTSPLTGHVRVTGGITDEDGNGGNGVSWFVTKGAGELARGAIENGWCSTSAFTGRDALNAIPVAAGETLYFVVDARGPDGVAAFDFDLTALDVNIAEVEPDAPPPAPDRWDLARDMRRAPIQQNPNFDDYGNVCAWTYEQGEGTAHDAPTSRLAETTQGFAGAQGLEAWVGSELSPLGNPMPFVGVNATADPLAGNTATWPPGTVNVHPSTERTAIVKWHSPFTGHVRVEGAVEDRDAGGGNGVLWYLDRGTETLASGGVMNGAQSLVDGAGGGTLGSVAVTRGDTIALIVAPGGNFDFDTTGLDLVITRVAAPRHRLTVTKAGAGRGTVTSVPDGIDCAPACAADGADYDDGEQVTLTAVPEPGSTFAGFEGDCSGGSPCTVTMDAAKNVTARFVKDTRRLTVIVFGQGGGSVSADVGGIAGCTTTCHADYQHGQRVTLTATPQPGWRFAAWSGGHCTGEGSCVLDMDADKGAHATFEPIDPPHRLVVSVFTTRAGTVTSDPAGIDCDDVCGFNFPGGTVVEVTQAAAPGFRFSHWSGPCEDPNADVCRVTMDADRGVTANFVDIPTGTTLEVFKLGAGAGGVRSAPAGITCFVDIQFDCSEAFPPGTEVTLTAEARPGSTFTRWTGDCTGEVPTCKVTMDRGRSVSAIFSLVQPTLSVVRSGGGAGRVTSDPPGIDCRNDNLPGCSHDYPDGTIVTLTATADEGSTFAGFSGPCTVTGPATCTVTMSQARTVTATFRPVDHLLTVVGVGSGTVTSMPLGIDCGGLTPDCSNSYAPGTEVTLTAVADTGWEFTGWSGACTGTEACVVQMTQDRSVTATFIRRPATDGVWSLARDFRTAFDETPSNPAPGEIGDDTWSLLYSDASSDLGTVRDPDAYHLLSIDETEPVLRWTEPGIEPLSTWMADGADPVWARHAVHVQPLEDRLAVVAWTSPIAGHVQVSGGMTDADSGFGNGVRWFLSRNAQDLASGTLGNGGCETVSFAGEATRAIAVEPGDVLYFAVDPRGPDGAADQGSDATAIDVTIRQVAPDAQAPAADRWSLAGDLRRAPVQQNPNFDSYGHLCAWRFAEGGAGVTSSPLGGLTQAYADVAGLEAWTGSDSLPGLGTPVPAIGMNTGPAPATLGTATLPSGRVVVHPSAQRAAIVGWRAPFAGWVRLSGGLEDLDHGAGDGVDWLVRRGTETLASGTVHDGAATFGPGLAATRVAKGDVLEVVVGARASEGGDATALDLVIERVPPPQHVLRIERAGGGSGAVTSADGGIDCGATCEKAYDEGTEVTLRATPATGSEFKGWSAAECPGTGDCTVTVTAARTITATFAKKRYALTAATTGNGSGRVVSTPVPSGIDCGSDCSETYDHGDEVTLTPTPQPGSSFTGWGGACAGAGECKVSMTQARTVTATFERIRHALNVTVEGAGTVTSAPAGIDCGTACVSSFDEGTAVSLSAAPQPGHRFAGWSGACTSDPCVVAMDAGRSVTARFERVVVRRKLTVLKVTDGSGIKAGRVTATPSGSPALDCGIRCTTQLDEGTEITLKVDEPLPNGSKFAGWTGGCVASRLSCTFRLGAADTRVNALFVSAKPAAVVGVAGTAKPVAGKVLVRRPVPAVAAAARVLLQAAAAEFFPLDGLQTVPVGSIVDTTHGTVELTVEDARGRSRKVRASGGLFVFGQARRGQAKGKTTLELTGGAFDACKGSRRVVRRLTVQGPGTGVHVRGRGSEATSRRAARWTTEDRCDATATKVKQGRVSVRDLKRRKTVTVRSGRSYAAAVTRPRP